MFLSGDVMTGRGVDQILPHPSRPVLYENWIRDAREYVRLAEGVSGRIPRQVGWEYMWGDALAELRRSRPEVKIINLETSVTCSEDAWPGKGIHYRMHPRNVECITAAGIDCCVLANNHVMDWGYAGLEETLRVLAGARVAHAGAGRDLAEAAAPAVMDVAGGGRVLVFSAGSRGSGIPLEWGAGEGRSGVQILEDLSVGSAREFTRRVGDARRPGDVVVASIHWGGNWGYEIPDEQVDFAHRLIDGGVDVVHGHSSHHVKGIEVYRGRLILYGCGDFLNDYEGIGGYEEFRSDLGLMYMVSVDARDGGLAGVRLVPMRVRRFRLGRASEEEGRWLCDVLNREGAAFGTGVRVEADGSLGLRW